MLCIMCTLHMVCYAFLGAFTFVKYGGGVQDAIAHPCSTFHSNM